MNNFREITKSLETLADVMAPAVRCMGCPAEDVCNEYNMTSCFSALKLWLQMESKSEDETKEMDAQQSIRNEGWKYE